MRASRCNRHDLFDSKQYDKALNYLKKAEPIFRNKKDWRLWYKCYWWATIIHAEETKKFEKATNWLRKGLEIGRQGREVLGVHNKKEIGRRERLGGDYKGVELGSLGR